jgi:hypothetical protein
VNKRSSKITGKILALVLVTGFISHPRASLNQLSEITRQFGVNVTRLALSQRLNSVTVKFLRLLFEEALQGWQPREGLWMELFEPFRGVYLIDSTHIRLANKLADSQPASGGQPGKALLRGKDKKVKKLIKKLRKRWSRYSLKEKRADRLSSYQQLRQFQVSTRDLLPAPDVRLICKVA